MMMLRFLAVALVLLVMLAMLGVTIYAAVILVDGWANNLTP